MEEGIGNYFRTQLKVEQVNPEQYSPLALAYIGDSVYDLIIRTMIVSGADMQVNKYHKAVSAIVKARAQANLIKKLEAVLTDEEMEIYKRGRNAKSNTKAKNAEIGEYRLATGFEALIGYLYLKEDMKRVIDLIKIARELSESEP